MTVWANVVNLTPHVVRLRRFDGSEIEFEPTLPSARVVMSKTTIVGSTKGAPIFSAPQWERVEGLPEPKPGTLYVVSALCALACAEREDVVSPATGPTDGCVRDDAGQVWAVTRFIAAKAAPPRPSCLLHTDCEIANELRHACVAEEIIR